MKTKIKIFSNLLITLLVALAFYACDDEWKGEQYEKYVSFVRSGYTETYLNGNAPDGIVHYKIPIEISGSTINDRNVTVSIALDVDTLNKYNKEQFYTRTDLYYLLLDEKHYSFPNGQTVTIPAGKDVGYINIDFKVDDLNLVEKFILPLQITSTSEYIPSPKKYYKKSLMRIIPFNYFSGVYSASTGILTADELNPTPTSKATREMRAVNDSTVFFYAGLCEEDARDRATYKVKARFNSDNTITFTADSAKIGFTPVPGKCTWKIEEKMDVLQPYLSIRTVTLDLQYQYKDVTNPSYTVTYNFKGSYTLERRRNTQIPEEDQQEIFEW